MYLTEFSILTWKYTFASLTCASFFVIYKSTPFAVSNTKGTRHQLSWIWCISWYLRYSVHIIRLLERYWSKNNFQKIKIIRRFLGRETMNLFGKVGTLRIWEFKKNNYELNSLFCTKRKHLHLFIKAKWCLGRSTECWMCLIIWILSSLFN